MIEKYRVHEVAKDLSLPSKEVIELLGKYFSSPKKHMTALEKDELSVIFEHYTQEAATENLDEYFARAELRKKKEAEPAPAPAAKEAPAAKQAPATKQTPAAAASQPKAAPKGSAPAAKTPPPSSKQKSKAPQKRQPRAHDSAASRRSCHRGTSGHHRRCPDRRPKACGYARRPGQPGQI